MTVKSVVIEAPIAIAGARAPMENILHHCPFCCNCFLNDPKSLITNSDYCRGTMEWNKFNSHLNMCIERNKDG